MMLIGREEFGAGGLGRNLDLSGEDGAIAQTVSGTLLKAGGNPLSGEKEEV